jgi:DNA uptake protein ComE-like DNA-binding protein
MRQNRAGAQRPARRVGTLRRHDTARRNGSLRRHGSLRRRGTVLIMVVAVLGILFVAGAALLNVVTFSSRSLDAAKIDRENRDAVDAVERLVTRVLAEAFIGPDGIPFAPESPLIMHKPGRPFEACDDADPNDGCVLALPAPAEIPGVHPWLDVTEPIDTGDAEYRLSSNIVAALQGEPMRQPASNANDTTLTIKVNQPEVGGSLGQGFILNLQGEPEFYNDAMGDGALTSVEMRLPAGVLPAELRRKLSDRLRSTFAPNASPDELTLTLRVIDHGAMVNLNDSHTYMKMVGLGLYDDGIMQNMKQQSTQLTSIMAGAPYIPESNEWILRNRGALMPLSVAPTRMVENLSVELFQAITPSDALYAAGLDASLMAQPTSRRWWSYNPVADTAMDDDPWRVLMNPLNADEGTYDVSHNLTTVGHDDLFMRGYQIAGQDILATIARDAQDSDGKVQSYDVNEGSFALDQYPQFLDGVDDLRRGRLKLSFPHLDKIRLANRLPGGNFNPEDKKQVIRLVQDAFLVMLGQRTDFNGDGDATRDADGTPNEADERAIAVQAAMLAANFFDYADFEPGHTPVVVRDLNGNEVAGTSPNSQRLVVYGFERQPFITEVYSSTSSLERGNPPRVVAEESSALFVIELYNPYNETIALSDYELTDLNLSPDTSVRDEISLDLVPRMRHQRLSDEIPGDATLSLDHPSRFKTFCCGYGATCPDGAIRLSEDDFAFDKDSQVALLRTVIDPDGNPIKIIVDRFDLSGASVIPDPIGLQLLGPGTSAPELGEVSDTEGETIAVAAQRDTSPGFWRFPVPRSVKVWGADEARLGEANSDETYTKSVQSDIYPVHLDVFIGNVGNSVTAEEQDYLTSAYPTTGSMLLVGRMAHVYEEVDDGSGNLIPGALTSPFNRTHGDLLGKIQKQQDKSILGQFDQIDNGRMPVFDVRPDVDLPRERNLDLSPLTTGGAPEVAYVAGRVEGLEALPWGQLIFDYFTAVPFEVLCPDPTEWTNPSCGREYPRVDQSGARVQGRVNINTASWRVLAGIPMIDLERLPNAYREQLSRTVSASREILGEDLARAIVAYREARDEWRQGGFVAGSVGRYGDHRSPYSSKDELSAEYRPRMGYGFLTVGELLNVRDPEAAGFEETQPQEVPRFDAGANSFPRGATVELTGRTYPAASFEHAIANIVALDDNWVTTRSHVFTIYGVIRGAHAPLPASTDPDYDAKLRSFNEANQKAIRFQSTVDRLPMIFGSRQPVRIGSRITGGYADVRSE